MAVPKNYDFGGYATKNDLRCADGRTIRRNAFKDCDGETVPLVWQHGHGKPNDILGHAILENRDDGVYTYGFFNESESGKNSKELVRHGDIRSLSIYANQLVQKGGDVLHGMIREVSLCLAGANPGAVIDDLSFEHYDDEDSEFEAQIYNGENIELAHSNEDAKETTTMTENQTLEEVVGTMTEDQRMSLMHALEKATKTDKDSDEKSDSKKDSKPEDEETIQDIIDTMTPKQKNVLSYVVGMALEKAKGDEKEDDNDEEDDSKMMEHAYEGNSATANELYHDALDTMVREGKRFGSLRESYNFHVEEGAIRHAIDTTGMETPTMTNQQYAESYGYGINEPSMLFPDPHNVNPIPSFIQRDTTWADVVWNGVHHTPWSRIKSVHANITEPEARAKGYLKGTQKKEEFFSIIKRVTVPQTIYKKQKFDRDDLIDITDFDTVAWIKSEMKVMLNEERARAILIGDGRVSGEDDKISEEHIRPIASDVPTYSIQKVVPTGATEEATAKNFMKAAVRARKDYKGSGNPILFTTEDVLTSMLLIEDGIGHYIYKSEAELATALRVSRIVTVPVMEGHLLSNGNELMGIIVNLRDYYTGADKGGEENMFDDFDIDYNQYKYLIETRMSGCLVVPYSAIVLSKVVSGNDGGNSNP